MLAQGRRICAGSEGAARPCRDDRAHFIIGVNRFECGNDFRVHGPFLRVELIGAALPLSGPARPRTSNPRATTAIEDSSTHAAGYRALRPDTMHHVQHKAFGSNRMDKVTIDRAAMGRLGKALVFIVGADHPTTVALLAAAESGAERDIKAARAMFLKLNPSHRRAALTMLED